MEKSHQRRRSPPLFGQFQEHFQFLFPKPFVLIKLLDLFPVIFQDQTFHSRTDPFLKICSIMRAFLFLHTFLQKISPQGNCQPQRLLLGTSEFPVKMNGLFFGILVLCPHFKSSGSNFHIFLKTT